MYEPTPIPNQSKKGTDTPTSKQAAMRSMVKKKHVVAIAMLFAGAFLFAYGFFWGRITS